MEASAVEFSKIAVGATDWDYYRYPFLPTIYSYIICSIFNLLNHQSVMVTSTILTHLWLKFGSRPIPNE